jgi:hypothetical protein
VSSRRPLVAKFANRWAYLDRPWGPGHTAPMRRTPRSSASPVTGGEGDGPDQIREFASQAVEYVRRSVGVTMEYDSETLPLLDHYLRQVMSPGAAPRSSNGHAAALPVATALVAATAGAYFGEVVRLRLGGSWHVPSTDPGTWRLVLPSGLWFFPTAMAMAAILGPDGDQTRSARDVDRDPDDYDLDRDIASASDRAADDDDDEEIDRDPGGEWDASLQAPPFLRPHVARVLNGMADVSEDEYYSLCCRLDTLEHVQAVLAAMASERQSRRRDPGALD